MIIIDLIADIDKKDMTKFENLVMVLFICMLVTLCIKNFVSSDVHLSHRSISFVRFKIVLTLIHPNDPIGTTPITSMSYVFLYICPSFVFFSLSEAC
jgi:uncharacterized membrane protein YesL